MEVNRLSAIAAKTQFLPEPHLSFFVDGVRLDELLDSWYPESSFIGLVPTTLDWMGCAMEQKEVWDRFMDRSNGTVIVPILCCPDDLDFSCTLVVVETSTSQNVVEWTRFGFDQTPFDQLPKGVGTNVVWFQPKQELVFSRIEYDSVAAEFQSWRHTVRSS